MFGTHIADPMGRMSKLLAILVTTSLIVIGQDTESRAGTYEARKPQPGKRPGNRKSGPKNTKKRKGNRKPNGLAGNQIDTYASKWARIAQQLIRQPRNDQPPFKRKL